MQISYANWVKDASPDLHRDCVDPALLGPWAVASRKCTMDHLNRQVETPPSSLSPFYRLTLQRIIGSTSRSPRAAIAPFAITF